MPSSKGGDRNSTDSVERNIPGAFPEPNLPTYTTNQQSLAHAVHARRAEFTRSKRIRIKIGTWNVAALKGTEKDIGGWFVGGKGIEEKFAGLGISARDSDKYSGGRESVEEQEQRQTKKQSTIPKGDPSQQPHGDEIGLYVLGLQEIVDVGSATEALKPYTDPAAANRYKTALEYELPSGYTLVAERQLIGMLLLIYASPTVAPEVKSVSTTSVGTGMMGYMGNKGAVTARIVIGETTHLVFINSHLAAGADKTSLDRRNWDYGQILSRTRFDPIEDTFGNTNNAGERIGEEDFAFWFGDLNYRLDAPGDDVRRLLMLHTRNEYDLSSAPNMKLEAELGRLEARREGDPNSSQNDLIQTTKDLESHELNEDLPPEEDPASLETTLLSLLSHDELHQQMVSRKAFYDGWQEAPIRFLPTYKYDVGSVGVFDSSDKRRGPSWCDRILHRTRADVQRYKRKVEEEEAVRKKDEEMKAKGLDATDEDDVLFDYNPEEDVDEGYDETAEPESVNVTTKSGDQAEIIQEYYNAHQRVLSSDHKPLDAIFSFIYDAVVPELKAKIHAEVAKELDRAENEGRPTVTVIADKVHGEDADENAPQHGGANESIDFGRVRFREHKSRNVTMANTGQVPATICFVNRPSSTEDVEEPPTPPWLSIEWDRAPDPSSVASPRSTRKHKGAMLAPMYKLDPGEACNVNLTVRVDAMELVNGLNDGSVKLTDILILRVQDGRDHFLPVTARWVQSGLDKTISKLTSLSESTIRKLQSQEPEASGSSGSSGRS
jgi:phosphatidylinositol-bisphosphatase